MADKEKLEKIKELADAMYYAAQHLSTDASRLHKAMDEYHKFIINEYHKEESVSEEFEEALAKEWQGYNDRGAATVDALEDNTQELAFAKGFYRGAKWQKEQMMANAVEGVVHHFEKCKVASVHYNDPTGVTMAYFTSTEGLSAGDKVKINVIKED